MKRKLNTKTAVDDGEFVCCFLVSLKLLDIHESWEAFESEDLIFCVNKYGTPYFN